MIDCSHGNSLKDHTKQRIAAASICEQVAGGSWSVFGTMLESHLVEGRQEYVPGKPAVYGQSITDACISLEQTEPILEQLAAAQQTARQAVGARSPEPAPSPDELHLQCGRPRTFVGRFRREPRVHAAGLQVPQLPAVLRRSDRVSRRHVDHHDGHELARLPADRFRLPAGGRRLRLAVPVVPPHAVRGHLRRPLESSPAARRHADRCRWSSRSCLPG